MSQINYMVKKANVSRLDKFMCIKKGSKKLKIESDRIPRQNEYDGNKCERNTAILMNQFCRYICYRFEIQREAGVS